MALLEKRKRDWGRISKISDELGRFRCSKCGEWKDPSEFNKNSQQKTVLSYACRECMRVATRKWNLPAKYNITSERFDEMLKEQDYKCAICNTDDPGATNWHADHNHKTGQKRGILCHKCNTGLGLLKDDVEILCAAIEYLHHYTK